MVVIGMYAYKAIKGKNLEEGEYLSVWLGSCSFLLAS